MNRANPFIGINIVQKWPRSSSLLTTGSYQRLYLCWHRAINTNKRQRYQYCNYWYIDILDMKRKNAVLSNFKWITVSFKKYKLKPIKNIIITAKNAWSVLMQEWCVVNVYFLYTFFSAKPYIAFTKYNNVCLYICAYANCYVILCFVKSNDDEEKL